MANIDIERTHTLGLDEVRKRVAQMEEKLKDRYGVRLSWRGDEADVKASGVTGTLSIAEAKVSINLKLGLMMKPLAGKLRESMEKQLDKALDKAQV